MTRAESLGWRLDATVARYAEGPVPESRNRPWYLAPMPEWLENIAFRLVWVLVGVNVAGTAFGFWFYGSHLASAPLVVWPIIPVSPLATLYIGISLACWRLGYDGRVAQFVHILAFIGCFKYGLWTVFVQSVITDPSDVKLWLWQFLIWSHAGMAIEAFLIPRYAAFSGWSVGLGSVWYVFNDIMDYFVSAFDGPHHTRIVAMYVDGVLARPSPAFEMMAVSAFVTTALGILFSVALWTVLDANRG
jgi:uncharacterized membrane protein YpjA